MSTMLRARWRETNAAVQRGYYTYDGREVALNPSLGPMRRGTLLYRPEDIAALPDPGPAAGPAAAAAAEKGTAVEVTTESTLAAARRLAVSGGVAALNFASARNPGGGVVNGARAQEESLARSSALYESLIRCPAFYEHHRAERDLRYSDRIIYSPGVPVFRDDNGAWLPEPYLVDFLTAAAPNRRMIERNTPHLADGVLPALRQRARGVLAVAAANGCTRLVLGAWGCGVFGNVPAEVAEVFRAHLAAEFAGAFAQVVFAVLDRPDGPTVAAFRDAFETGG
ncbi:uncharacterized protein (TIGR02452 family) [Murinocardiopsis flavida]|uniref:Uncharacterized protein (TIGR02452 family) n=1 Tax=Murinocardiopsis flavida TaxID=645275 RepID=A0A2P8DH52_9ACTN|nr:TIGR02452 family protein [Murinocardiopsis flavida]PSK96541.1 uncharacterized protein (TIGR02452 family) [Murinocardiopsis flavida]